MRKIYFSVIALSVVLILLSSSIALARSVNMDPDCSYILIDGKTGQVILEKNADVKRRPASTTKIMTAAVALEDGNINKIVNVSKEAVNDIGRDGMNIGILPGESNLTLENLINVMLIKSANETANIIAENVGSSRQEFIERMNKKAAELGAVNTHFVNPCGKDDAREDENHLTTARDLAIIARYAMTIPKFREIVSKEYYNDLPNKDKHKGWESLHTTNKLMWGKNNYPYIIDGKNHSFVVNGIKTGYTGAAGNNLVSSAVNEDGMELIAVVMHVTGGNNKVFSYTKELLRYGFEHYSNQQIIGSNQFVKTVAVQDAKDNGELNLVTSSNFTAALPLDKSKWNIESVEHINLPVKAPVNQGDVLGYIEYKRNGITLGKVDIIASRKVEKAVDKVIKDTFNKIMLNKITIILFTFIGYLIFRRYFRKTKKRR